jgi:hypothetical protein
MRSWLWLRTPPTKRIRHSPRCSSKRNTWSQGVLLAHRRPRSPEEPPIWAAHVLVGATGAIQYETDRARFLGRSKTPESPESLRRDLSGSVGTVIDPIFSLRCRAVIEPRVRLEISFLTMAADSRDALLSLIDKFQRPDPWRGPSRWLGRARSSSFAT